MNAATEPIGATYRSLDAIVREEILRRILAGELEPGARLIENSIADELGVSRGPVRAAIRQLELEGFVVVSPRRGASVATTSAVEALECYEVRTVLEELSARLAAARRSEADIDSMREILNAGSESMRQRRWDDLSRLNNEFHVALAVASGNSQLVLLMQQYSKRIAWMFSRSAEQRGAVAWEEHGAIIAAVENRDAELASRLAHEHIQSSREQFVLSTPIAATVPVPKATPPAKLR